MRNALLAAFLICIFSGTNPFAPVLTDKDSHFADGRFFETLENMIPVRYVEPKQDSFFVEAAIWSDVDRSLVVKARTDHEKGTLLTLMGLPASTMLDAFRISANHSVEYLLPLAEGQAVPCRVVVKSAFEAETVNVMNAPSACQSMLEVSGIATVGPALPMVNAWVTVTVDDVVFTTIADENGAYDLEVYSDSRDAFVRITAEGKVDDKESVVHIYAGSIDRLLNAENLSASAWAVEFLGRKHMRHMLAAL